ncbi:MAG: winged helix-turn-helix transcriptional regulator [Anaerolineae bacterium]
MAGTVLVIDDNPSMAEAAQPALLRHGYRLDHARPTQLDLGQLQRAQPDIVVLNSARPQDEWFIYGQLVTLLKSPLFLLLNLHSQPLPLSGLENSPLLLRLPHLIEQASHIRALLRGDPPPPCQQGPSSFVDEELAVDLIRQEVRRQGQLVALTPTEFRLLASFVRHPDVLLTHPVLLAEVWGLSHRRNPAALRPHIHNLRRKLEPDLDQPQRIVTCRGKGYTFRRMQTH